MTKRSSIVALVQNDQGQISIFFSASLIVMVTIVAFVINIGLFVKAKINLQNATDSAAYAGAAVQARQLSKIAYLNWEMRNIYKEWLYKYYVVGNLNIQDVENPDGDGAMSFRMQKDVEVLSGLQTPDQFNIPAVCIHIAGSKTNVCKRYSVPGLPEFGPAQLPGADEASRIFMDSLIGSKVNDCIDRTKLNMLVANTWTYNILADDFDESLSNRAPAILADRQGAWPKAVELAMRIRNLESIMNRSPVTEGVCSGGSTNLTACQSSITDLESEPKLGNERIVKAFYSAYRNLGNETDNEMKNSFTLTEIPPKEFFKENATNTSNLLLPENSLARKKYFIDLKIMLANFSIFYAALIPRADSATSGACDISKVAIPVPGYPLGFYKNPDVLTYYAVRGEAEFVGMFNPFGNPVKLTSFSAAKPFGGRIGPALFTQREGDDAIRGRGSPTFRSLPYITSFDFLGTTIRGKEYDEVKFIPGLPLPTNSNEPPGAFWLEEPNSPVGGKLNDTNAVQFGLPNMVYKYQAPFSKEGYTLQTDPIHKIESKLDQSNDKPVGLFSKFQFREFKGNSLSGQVSPGVLDQEIARVRAPTDYEAANYLIPTPSDLNLSGGGLDSFGFISPINEKEDLENGYIRYRARVYAPLYGSEPEDLLYKTPQEVGTAIFDFLRAQESGIKKYQLALNRAAKNIWDTQPPNAAQASIVGYRKAAEGVSDIDLSSNDLNQTPKSCDSILGQFLHFYYGHPDLLPGQFSPENKDSCPKPMGELLIEYFSSTSQDPTYDPNFYQFDLSWKGDQISIDQGKTFLSAYTPGPFSGVSLEGNLVNEIPGGPGDNMQRNFYSTKFVSLDSLQTEGFENYNNPQFVIFSEGNTNDGTPETNQSTFLNHLDPDAISADLSNIKY